MIHILSICLTFLCLVSVYVPVSAKDVIAGVAPGWDATFHCTSDTGVLPQWEWESKKSNVKTVVINSTAYLLVENFQKSNEGYYNCVNGATTFLTVKFKLQEGVRNQHIVLYRGSNVGSLHLYCKILSAAKYQGQWSWRQTGSERDCTGPGIDPEHFQNRSTIKKGTDNDFSLTVSPLHWNDSGYYRCVLCKDSILDRECSYEIITIKVYCDPGELAEGDDVSLVCVVSHVKNSTRLLWIDELNRQQLPSPEQHTSSEFRLWVQNITLRQTAWTCALYHLDHLKALVPLKLSIKERHKQTHESTTGGEWRMQEKTYYNSETATALLPTEDSHMYPPLICIIGVLHLCLGTVFILYWHRRCKGKDEEKTSNDVDVEYAEIRLKGEKQVDSNISLPSATDNLVSEEDSVIYSTVAL